MAGDKWRSLRDAAWVDERVRGYSTILLCGSVGVLLWLLAGHGGNDPVGRPVGTDFLQFWTGSWAALHGKVRALYRLRDLAALERSLFPTVDMRDSVYAWLYPPTLLLVVAPLALLPYLWAWLCWLGLGFGVYAAALWRILPDRSTILAGLGFPAVLLTATHGQTSAILVPLLAWGLLLLPRWPVLAGLLLGVLAVKPQVAMLVPLVLIAGGHWRALLAAWAMALVMAMASASWFGLQSWTAFLSIAPLARDILAHGTLSPYYKMQSVFSALRLLDAPVLPAYVFQGLAAAGAIVAVIWGWCGKAEQGLKNALLCAAIPLATPYFMDYDLLVLAPAIAWLASAAARSGVRPWERLAMVMAFLLPLFARVLGEFTHLEPAPLIEAALVWVILTRISDQRAAVPAISAAVAN